MLISSISIRQLKLCLNGINELSIGESYIFSLSRYYLLSRPKVRSQYENAQ